MSPFEDYIMAMWPPQNNNFLVGLPWAAMDQFLFFFLSILFYILLFYFIFYFIFGLISLETQHETSGQPSRALLSRNSLRLWEQPARGAEPAQPATFLWGQFHLSAWFSIVAVEDLSFGDSALVRSQTCLPSSSSNRNIQRCPLLSPSEGWPPWHCRETPAPTGHSLSFPLCSEVTALYLSSHPSLLRTVNPGPQSTPSLPSFSGPALTLPWRSPAPLLAPSGSQTQVGLNPCSAAYKLPTSDAGGSG